MKLKIDYRVKPITLYVSEISEADGEHHGQEMERIIDVELSKPDARKLIAILQKNIDTIPGSKTFRLKGRLIL